jgi:hypothetical protein
VFQLVRNTSANASKTAAGLSAAGRCGRSKLFDLAHTWIMHQQQADAKARKESEQAAA